MGISRYLWQVQGHRRKLQVEILSWEHYNVNLMTGSSLASSCSCFRNLSRLPWHIPPRFPEFRPKAFPAKPPSGCRKLHWPPCKVIRDRNWALVLWAPYHALVWDGMEGYDLLHGYTESSQKVTSSVGEFICSSAERDHLWGASWPVKLIRFRGGLSGG